MGFKLNIRTANAAFEGYPNEEVARILREVADWVENGRTEGQPMDINGNGVGSFELTEEDE